MCRNWAPLQYYITAPYTELCSWAQQILLGTGSVQLSISVNPFQNDKSKAEDYSIHEQKTYPMSGEFNGYMANQRIYEIKL